MDVEPLSDDVNEDLLEMAVQMAEAAEKMQFDADDIEGDL